MYNIFDDPINYIKSSMKQEQIYIYIYIYIIK